MVISTSEWTCAGGGRSSLNCALCAFAIRPVLLVRVVRVAACSDRPVLSDAAQLDRASSRLDGQENSALHDFSRYESRRISDVACRPDASQCVFV